MLRTQPIAALLSVVFSAYPCAAMQSSAGVVIQAGDTPALTNAPRGTADVDSLIVRMGHASWSEREAATRALEVLCAEGAVSAEQLLKREDLNPEQRNRVLAMARDEFFARQPAALGINMDIQHGAAGVRIANTFGNFPSSTVIAPGDIILRMGGVALDSQDPDEKRDVLGHLIRSFFPGESVPLVILRNGKQMEVAVEMGRFGDLDRIDQRRRGIPAELQYAAREACWAYRSGRLCASETTQSADATLPDGQSDALLGSDAPGMGGQKRTIIAGEPSGEVRWGVGIGAQPSQDSVLDSMRNLTIEISNEVALHDLASARLASVPLNDAERLRLTTSIEDGRATIRRLANERCDLAALLREVWR